MKTLTDYEFYKEDLVTIYHGDCLEVLPLLEGDFALFTDPPYYNLDLSWMSEMAVAHNRNPNVSDDKIERTPDLENYSFLFKYPKRLIWGYPYIMDAEATGWIVWDKQPKIDWRGIGTPVEVASTTLRTGFDLVHCMWAGYLADFEVGEARYAHPTQKPLKVIRGIMEQSWFTKLSDLIILDPFVGSGTTCVAAKQLGLKSIGIDKELKYCQLSKDRVKGETCKTTGLFVKKIV